MTFTAGKLREDHPAAASEGSTGGMAESQLHVTWSEVAPSRSIGILGPVVMPISLYSMCGRPSDPYLQL